MWIGGGASITTGSSGSGGHGQSSGHQSGREPELEVSSSVLDPSGGSGSAGNDGDSLPGGSNGGMNGGGGIRVRTNRAVSSQGTPLQWIGMNELGAVRWAKTALGNGFRLQEPANFSVARVRWAGLVVAEQLPLR